MFELVCITSRVVSIVGGSYVHHLTAHKVNCNRGAIELSQDLIRELQSHLQDIVDLTQVHSKEGDHDGSANLRSNAIMTMLSLLEIHRTLAGSEIASAAVRQHSRSKCGGLLSDITFTAQKVVVAHGKYLSGFIVVSIGGLLRIFAHSRRSSTTHRMKHTPQILQTSSRL